VEDEYQEVSLIDESGVERRFRLHDAFDVEGSTYYLVEATDDPEMVLLLKESGAGLESVEQAEFERVLAQLEADEGN
jgi:diaminopimelate decarboxylase